MRFPWYDSIWLDAYVQARSILKDSPADLEHFEQSLAPLQGPASFETKRLEKFLNDQRLSEARAVIRELPTDSLTNNEFFQFGRRIQRDHDYFSQLAEACVDIVSELAGEPLEPCYNFVSLYNNFGICEPHMDAPHSKWTLDICLEQSAPWPIQISEHVPWPVDQVFSDNWKNEIINGQSAFTAFTVNPGDALFFNGSNQWHYRERIPRSLKQNFCHLVFLHYIPVGFSELVQPLNWANALNLPRLSTLCERYLTFMEGRPEERGDFHTFLQSVRQTSE